jgi:hypothetical protein
MDSGRRLETPESEMRIFNTKNNSSRQIFSPNMQHNVDGMGSLHMVDCVIGQEPQA